MTKLGVNILSFSYLLLIASFFINCFRSFLAADSSQLRKPIPIIIIIIYLILNFFVALFKFKIILL
jgi:hypothetical protein